MRYPSMSALTLAALAVLAPTQETVADTAPIIFSAAGVNAAAIVPTVDAFKSALGPLNPNVAGSFGTGRREINWDGVPDTFAAPNQLPANFFNANSPRGVVLSTPGTGFQVSANANNASGTPVQFGNIDPAYPSVFEPFSSQKLFTTLGSNVVDVKFFVPGSTNVALSNGFGVVFSDVDIPDATSLIFFGKNNELLGTFSVPAIPGNETFSFLGVLFDSPLVSMVRILSGNASLGPGKFDPDIVVMDDFIYGEPVAVVPLPGGLALFATGLGVLGLLGWGRKKKAAGLAV